MPMLPPNACTQAGCPRPSVRGGRCMEHQRKWTYETAMIRSSAALGYGADWQRRRAKFLADNPECAVCGEPSTDVDHIIPKRDGGEDDDSNWQALCHSHHSAKTMRETMRRRRR